MRLVIGDISGTLLAELDVELGPVSWRLNEVGKINFAIAQSNLKATREILRFGNRCLIEFDNGLPNWGGIIDPPRDWSYGKITCAAYSAEYILGTRITDKGRYFTNQTVGYIFEHLIEEANSVMDTGIGVGEMWGSGDGHYPDYHFDNLLKISQESLCSRLSTSDFEIIGSVSGGRIVFTANIYERQGVEKPNVVLMEGHNLADIRLLEQGPIINWWDTAGDGSDWGAGRLTGHAEDGVSIGLYGLRQDAKIYSGVSLQGTLDTHTDNLLAESKEPHNMLDLKCVDLAPALWADYGVGDSVRVILSSFGFGGYDHMVRIYGREYDPKTGYCMLVVREDI